MTILTPDEWIHAIADDYMQLPTEVRALWPFELMLSMIRKQQELKTRRNMETAYRMRRGAVIL